MCKFYNFTGLYFQEFHESAGIHENLENILSFAHPVYIVCKYGTTQQHSCKEKHELTFQTAIHKILVQRKLELTW